MLLNQLAFVLLFAAVLAAPQTSYMKCGSKPTDEMLNAVDSMAVEEASGNFTFHPAWQTVEVDINFHVVIEGKL
jgi:hypothetical protein